MKKGSRIETEKKIKSFFEEIKEKSPREIKKMKKLAMNQNIPLKEKRKFFCRYCLNPYSKKENIRIKKGMKSITCEKCGKISRWKIKIS